MPQYGAHPEKCRCNDCKAPDSFIAKVERKWAWKRGDRDEVFWANMTMTFGKLPSPALRARLYDLVKKQKRPPSTEGLSPSECDELKDWTTKLIQKGIVSLTAGKPGPPVQ